MKHVGLTAIIFLFSSCQKNFMQPEQSNPKEKAFIAVKQRALKHGDSHRFIWAPEGEFVAVFNPEMAPFVAKELKARDFKKLREILAPHLRVELTERGFAQAATRDALDDKEEDDTNYDAVWVRDSAWIYFALKASGRKEDASKLVLALWEYYSTPHQINRLKNIIKNPSLKEQAMEMPHIRFDGESPGLEDVQENGAPQNWNHKQIDAHGLFLLSLADAFESGLIDSADNSLAKNKWESLALFPLFFSKINYHDYEDAGAWEEIDRKNSSSIALASKALSAWNRLLASSSDLRQRLQKLAPDSNSWSSAEMGKLALNGLKTVKKQLALGGESPDYPVGDMKFRRSDAALMTLVLPHPMEGLKEDELRLSLDQIEKLKRPFGVLRYENDSYQSGNYWIEDPDQEKKKSAAPTATGDSSSAQDFQNRFKNFIPHSEAQWFFDSKLALARLRLAQMATSPKRKKQDLALAKLHFKRALGQLTGSWEAVGMIDAQGNKLRNFSAPESLNTVVIQGKRFYYPSPITPLNWAKAGLIWALAEFENL